MAVRHPNHPGELSSEPAAAARLRSEGELNARAEALRALTHEGVPFLVGGAYAFGTYTGIYRDTKDLDLFPRRRDALRCLKVLERRGWRVERTDESWIYKGFWGEWYVDLIFSSGNGVAEVDDEWFEHARRVAIMGEQVLVVPPEEMIWSKAFVLERERYDGADVIHLLKCVGQSLDWGRLLRRFDRYWEVLLSHVLLFRFTYPGERAFVPSWVMADLTRRVEQSVGEGAGPDRLCRGPLLSRFNFTLDVSEWGYEDGRRWDERQRANGGHDAQRAGNADPGGGGR